MRTKLSLAPLLVLAALAVLPGEAQATSPRLFEDGVEIGTAAFENPQPLLGWGRLKLENSEFGKITCENAFGLRGENPPGNPGGAAATVGITGWVLYNCSNPTCEAVGRPRPFELFPLGEGETLTEKKTVEHITTPWEATVVEAPASSGKFRLKMGNKIEKSENVAKYEKHIRFEVECFAKGYTAEFHGELVPAIKNGTLIGAAPAELEFEFVGETGELQGNFVGGSGNPGGARVRGSIKVFGYNEGDVLMVKQA